MVTRRQLQDRVNELQAEGLSGRATARQLRSEGFRFGNDEIRTRYQLAGIQAERGVSDIDAVPYLPPSRRKRGLLITGANISDRSSYGRATYVAVDYRSEYRAIISQNGVGVDDIDGEFEGRFVQQIDWYDETLVEERVVQQIMGQLREQYSSYGGSNDESIGIDVTLTSLRILDTELRGIGTTLRNR